MAWTIPKQTLAGQLSNSNLSGNIGVPKQLIAADLQHMTPVLVNGTITLPMPQIVANLQNAAPVWVSSTIAVPMQPVSGVLDNPPQIVGNVDLPMQAVSGELHYVFIARKHFSADWYLTEPGSASNTAPADVGQFAKQRVSSRWWLTQPVSEQSAAPHDLGIWAKARFTARYPLRLATVAAATWRMPISQTHQSPYGWREVAAHAGSYAITHPLRCVHGATYRMCEFGSIGQNHRAHWSIKVGRQLVVPLDEMLRVGSQRVMPYGDANCVSAQHSTAFTIRGLIRQSAMSAYRMREGNRVASAHAGRYALRLACQLTSGWAPVARIEVTCAADYQLQPVIRSKRSGLYALTAHSVRSFTGISDLALLNTSQQQHRLLFEDGNAQIQQFNHLPRLIHRGQSIEVLSVSISMDERSPYWIARADLADLTAMQRMRLGDGIALHLGSAIFQLRIDSRALIRQSPADVRVSLTAISPLAWLAPPHGQPVTQVWDVPVQSSDVVAGLLPGFAIDWQLDDWLIPAGRLAASAANPVEIATNVVKAAGGLIESQADGSLLVRHLFPTTIPRYAQALASATLNEALDVFEISETDEIRAGTNLLRITDGQSSSGQDQVEFIRAADDALAGTVRVMPAPWREVSLAHTGDAGVTIQAMGIVTRDETELVEFKAGRAQSKYPIDSLLAVNWQYANLGSVTAANGGQSLQAGDNGGYSLARIRYQTRAYEYRVGHVRAESIQFLVIS